jgi:hypothetical protein
LLIYCAPGRIRTPTIWFEGRFCIGQISINQSLVALAIGHVDLFKSQLRHSQFGTHTIPKFVASECPLPGVSSVNYRPKAVVQRQTIVASYLTLTVCNGAFALFVRPTPQSDPWRHDHRDRLIAGPLA